MLLLIDLLFEYIFLQSISSELVLEKFSALVNYGDNTGVIFILGKKQENFKIRKRYEIHKVTRSNSTENFILIGRERKTIFWIFFYQDGKKEEYIKY